MLNLQRKYHEIIELIRNKQRNASMEDFSSPTVLLFFDNLNDLLPLLFCSHFVYYLFIYILSICTNAIPNDRSEGRKYINLYVCMFLNVFDEHNSFADQ